MNKIDEFQIKKYFNKNFEELCSRVTRKDAFSYNYQQKRKWILNHLKNIEGSMLDIGCNIGNLEYMIRKNGINNDQLRIFGIDIAEESIKYAKTRNIENCLFSVGSIYKIDFPNDSFDAICLVEVLEHIHNKKNALKEIYRVLKSGGLFLITTPNAECKPWIIDEKIKHFASMIFFKKKIHKDETISISELSNLLNDIGFQEKEKPFFYWYRPYNILKGKVIWPLKYSYKGLLNTMKECELLSQKNVSRTEYFQSIIACTTK